MFAKLFSDYLSQCVHALETSDDPQLKEDITRLKALLVDKFDFEMKSFIHHFTILGFAGVESEEDEIEAIKEVIHGLVEEYQNRCKLYTLHIAVKGQEEHVWRDVIIPATASLEDLCYAILSMFRCEGGHLFDISYKKVVYTCGPNSDYGDEDASTTSLASLKLSKRSKLFMTYDYGDNYEFVVSVKQIEKTKIVPYFDELKIIDGKGYGILEDCHYIFDAFYDNKKEDVEEYLDDLGLEWEDLELNELFDKEEANRILLSEMQAFKDELGGFNPNDEEDEWEDFADDFNDFFA